MPRKPSAMSIRQFTELNLTPLIDLSFLLLVTFIVTFPAVKEENAMPIKLPSGKTSSLPSGKTRTINVDRKGVIFLDGTQVSVEGLTKQMQEAAKSDPAMTILVRADQDVRYAEVIKVMRVLHDTRMTKLALVTEAEGAGK